MNLFNKLMTRMFDLMINTIFQIRVLLYVDKYLKCKKVINQKITSLDYLNQNDQKYWIKGFNNLIKTNIKKMDVFLGFAESNIKAIKTNYLFDNKKPILICVVKDDLVRIKALIKHHKQIGIENFIFLDNGSTDGTFEYLFNIEEIHLYQTNDCYTSSAKYGWINKILSFYGFNRWYLYVDSDEAFVYFDCEKIKIDQLINKINNKHLDQLHSILLDMYSKNKLYVENTENIHEKFKYFDANHYKKTYKLRGAIIRGGPRRIFFKDKNLWPILNKTPLFKFKPKMIFESAHFLNPYHFFKPVHSVLLHYKFMAEDQKKYFQRSKQGNFAAGGREYRAYATRIADGEFICFYHEHSIIYENSHSLSQLKFIKRI